MTSELSTVIAQIAIDTIPNGHGYVRACVNCLTRASSHALGESCPATGRSHVYGSFKRCATCLGRGGYTAPGPRGLGDPESEVLCPKCDGSRLEGLI